MNKQHCIEQKLQENNERLNGIYALMSLNSEHHKSQNFLYQQIQDLLRQQNILLAEKTLLKKGSL